MQYPNSYSHNGQPHVSTHHPRQSSSSSNTHTSTYPQQSQVLSPYPLDTTMPNGIIGNHSNPLQAHLYPQHGAPPMDPRRSYYPPPPAPPPPANQPNTYYPSHHHSSGPSSQYAINSHTHIDPQSLQHAHSQFIPTPSQTYQVYSNTVPSNPRSRPSIEPYYHMSPNPQHTTQGSPPPAASRSAHTSPSSNPALVGDRFPCELCDRSFTRSHDRRRHYETVHATTPVLHRCRYCGKDFSRADSLKRHIDNGCDEMLSHK
ncbi:hypothetical protein DEU56DRAFT_204246 [Suillus clintonianus]|uniref:uncharacterized protein n=1 Tax=Suillus clintonianus TaxID=1904413 RepID=UPI001B85D1AE|nr:uncharacterized protein DEU56DRAFT_204246 [Suillus clintonianus]KAG2112085.1 hypothetical protein DEU56DRAFT_204246 [Suillus clintonianus]